MAGDLVLVTGATGFVGFRTLRTTLEHGYNVRAVFRSESKAQAVLKNPALKELTSSNLTTAIVPDFLAPNAFDEVVKGVKYIIHIASPLPPTGSVEGMDLKVEVVDPAVQGTLGVLESAKKAGGVKRIVITSSVVATVPTSLLLGTPVEDGQSFGPTYRADDIPAPYMGMGIVAYVASKIAALRRAEEWVAAEEPDFDIIHIHPSYVEGRDDSTTTVAAFANGTNRLLLDPILGKNGDQPLTPTMVHVDDVALAHVKALNPSVPGNRSFVLSTSGQEGIQWDSAKDIAKKHFPEAVEDGRLPCSGSQPTFANGKVDAQETRTVLGIESQGFESMVVSVVGHYLEVSEKEKK